METFKTVLAASLAIGGVAILTFLIISMIRLRVMAAQAKAKQVEFEMQKALLERKMKNSEKDLETLTSLFEGSKQLVETVKGVFNELQEANGGDQ